MIETSLIAPCLAYLGRAEGEAARGQRMAGELETASERPRSETVQDPAPGTIPAVPGYFRRTREICDRHGGLPNLDKGICGRGRTGTLFACDQHGIAPDIAAIAKGLGAGFSRWGRCCVPPAIEAGSGPFPHGPPYGPSDRRRADGADPADPGRAARAGADHGRKARGSPARGPWRAPHVGDIRSQDLFRGIERPKDRAGLPPSRPGAGPMPGSPPPLSRPACSAIRWAAPLTGGRAIRFCWPRPSPLTALMPLKSRISCNSPWPPCGEPPRLAPCHQEALELRRILIFIQAENRKRAVEPPASDHVGSPPQRKSVRCPARCVSMS
ncbi:aminotransferase class III-fold pyridoxal phosphate-dependent enzyme [Rhodovulum sulfidophilum]|nr:aminotransferase class III-fold pyridoxal phosphate-dependent enzyme [Rhodovulum sulfidophilum]